jgi:hypothetical protein
MACRAPDHSGARRMSERWRALEPIAAQIAASELLANASRP